IKNDDGEADPVTIGAVIQNNVSGCGCPLQFFNGVIDEVDYFPRALSGPEVHAIFQAGSAGKVLNRPGLVSWYRAEDNPTDAADSNHGTLQNGATFAAGQVGRAFNFDGVDDYVDIGQQSQLQNATALTVGAWIRRADTTNSNSG